jgi:branched-chain amino acid transport system permease protein
MSENENLSAAIGVDTWAMKTLAFCLGSFFAGYNGFVAPTDFTPQFMFKVIAAVVIGGNRTFWGPILGLIALTLIDEALRGAAELVPLVWGVAIILTMLYLPEGLEGLARRLSPRAGAGRAMIKGGTADASRA